MPARFFGKYRGTVASNLDPLRQGRLQVNVPAVLSEQTAWAMPCVPYAGPLVGLVLLPPGGANVWVEFEGGDPDYPIWTGGFWGIGEMPVGATLPTTKVLATEGVSVRLDELPGAGGLTLEVNPPAVAAPIRLSMTSRGLLIDAGTATVRVDLAGIELSVGAASVQLDPATVNLNRGALEVI